MSVSPLAPTMPLAGAEVRARVFLEDLRIDYGPANLLGRFFLRAENAVRAIGITLRFASLAEASHIQSQNIGSWPLFPPMLDCRRSNIDPGMSYALVGQDTKGELVCVQGGRIYETNDFTLADIISDQSFFYGANHTAGSDQPTCTITAPGAAQIKGRFVYSGALWVHPDHRGHRLAAILPRISRAYALARWNTAYTIALVSHQIAASPLLAMYGYNNIEHDFCIRNLGPTDMTGCLMWMDRDELVADLARFMASNLAQVDAAVGSSSSEDQSPAIAKSKRRRQP